MKSTQQDFTPGRRNARKRCGNIATGNIQAQSWDKLALFHNMSNPEYRDIVFGKEGVGSVFAKYREPFQKEGLTKKRTIEVVDEGIEMILTRRRCSINILNYI